MDAITELYRLLGNMIRLGIVTEVDHEAARCLVKSGELTTAPLPWLIPRVGDTSEWSAPTTGEQVVVISPGGDINQGLVLRGIYSQANPAPENSETAHLVKYPDGAVIEYDHGAHTLKATLPGGGSAEITADAGVTVNGPLTVNGDTQITGTTQIDGDTSITGEVAVDGTIEASGDVTGEDISLAHHKHPGVQSGSAKTGEPE